MKKHVMTLTGALLIASLGGVNSMAQDTNTLELIRQLQRRIDQLEEQVKTLQGTNQPAPPLVKSGAETQRPESGAQ